MKPVDTQEQITSDQNYHRPRFKKHSLIYIEAKLFYPISMDAP